MNKFQYYLLDEDGKSYYVANGSVLLSPEPVALPNSPDGWQDLLIGYERNMQKYGIIRNFTLPLGFVLDGARIIRELYYSSNIEKHITLLITKLDLGYTSTNFLYSYSKFYEGEIDLSTFKDEDGKVSVVVAEGSYAKKLKAAEGTAFEIPFEAEAIRVKMDGIFLYQKHNWLIQTGLAAGDNILGTLFTVAEGTAAGFASFSVYRDSQIGAYTTQDFTTRNDYFFITTQAIDDIHISGSVKYKGGFGSGTVRLFLKTSTGREIALNSGSQGGATLNINTTFDALADEKFFLIADVNGPSSIIYEETTITIDFKSRYKETYIKAYKPFDLFKKLTGKVLGDETLALSELLETNANICVTSGDAVRSIEGAKIKTTLNTFFEAYNVLLNAGLSLENNYLRLEEKARYFDTSNPIHLGSAKNLKVYPATDLMANTVKIGYPVQQTDDVNGKYAFNNTHIYSSPLTRVVKELSLICPYITDPYAIELFRINLEGKTTTDNASDNNVMILNVDLDNPQTDNLGTYYNLKRVVYDNQSNPNIGIPDPESTFNIEQLTPKRLLNTHREWLNSILYGFENNDLTFQTTEKNPDLYTDLAGLIVDENANFSIDTDRLFIPIYVEFDTMVPFDLVSLLSADQNRCFTFYWKGTTYEGFLIKGGIAPNDNKEQAYKLLLTPNNTLTTLI